MNLIGKLEGWGIGPATPVAEVSIKVSAATGAQLKELLKKLPDGMTFEPYFKRDFGRFSRDTLEGTPKMVAFGPPRADVLGKIA